MKPEVVRSSTTFMTPEEARSSLAKEWDGLMDDVNVMRGELRLKAFAQLISAYSEPHRHYHNFDHILRMFMWLFDYQFYTGEWEVQPNLLLAIWYHDVVYDTRSSENEARSAEFAKNSLGELGWNAQDVTRVCQLILMTKDHQAPPDDHEAALFLDMDLSILGMLPARYSEYAAAIRKEYSWVSDREYYQGRHIVLNNFLMRPAIFRTDYAKFDEARARANITAEIAQLDEKLRTLPS